MPSSGKTPRVRGCNGAACAMIGIIIAKPMEPNYRKTNGTKISHPVLGEAWTRDAGRQSINQLPGLPNLPQAAIRSA